MSKGYYSLIQYCPDFARAEAVNVGVLVFRSEPAAIAVRVVDDVKFVGRRLGLKLHAATVLEVVRAAHYRLTHATFRSVADLERFARSQGNDIQLTPPRAMLVDEPEGDVDEVFRELVDGGGRSRPKTKNPPRTMPPLAPLGGRGLLREATAMKDDKAADGADGSGPRSALVLYQTDDGVTRIECRFEDESIWLTQALLANLFEKDVRTINEHIANIYEDGELLPEATIRNFRIVRTEGVRQVTRDIEHYSLEVILAVGYRVNSPRGTQFRQWATARLSEFLVKGFTMDDERLKNPPGPGVPDYFDELLARIRDIRASEKRMYTRVRDILALAADYAPSTETTQAAFFTVQNKLHHAVTGLTAPELIAQRVDAGKPNMGLTTWAGDRVRRTDVTVAKNYLREGEIGELNRIVVMFLDFAEDQAQRRKQVFLCDWPKKLDEFLKFHERAVLGNAGKMRRDDADAKAIGEFEQFEVRRREEAEAAGEADALKALEEIAKKLPKRRGHTRKDGDMGGGDA